MTIMPTTAKATRTGYSNRAKPRRVMKSREMISTAAAETRMVTLANRAKASLVNMPPKPVSVPVWPMPIHSARATISPDVAQVSASVSASLPVYTATNRAAIA